MPSGSEIRGNRSHLRPTSKTMYTPEAPPSTPPPTPQIKQIKCGIDNEEKAREYYIQIKKKHEGFECRLSGFDPVRPYLRAPAEGIASCKCCLPRVVEIKCPFKHRDITPIEAATIDPFFCIDKDETVLHPGSATDACQ